MLVRLLYASRAAEDMNDASIKSIAQRAAPLLTRYT
jgi:hypothetical protein